MKSTKAQLMGKLNVYKLSKNTYYSVLVLLKGTLCTDPAPPPLCRLFSTVHPKLSLLLHTPTTTVYNHQRVKAGILEVNLSQRGSERADFKLRHWLSGCHPIHLLVGISSNRSVPEEQRSLGNTVEDGISSTPSLMNLWTVLLQVLNDT